MNNLFFFLFFFFFTKNKKVQSQSPAFASFPIKKQDVTLIHFYMTMNATKDEASMILVSITCEDIQILYVDTHTLTWLWAGLLQGFLLLELWHYAKHATPTVSFSILEGVILSHTKWPVSLRVKELQNTHFTFVSILYVYTIVEKFGVRKIF